MPTRPLVIAVEGASAAGKSTVVARAAQSMGWVPLAEAYDRIAPPLELRFSSDRELERIERILLDEEARRWAAARALRAAGRTVIADTDFLGPLTYTAGLVELGRAAPRVLRVVCRRALRYALRGQWGLPDGLIYLETSARLRQRRAAEDPGRHPPDLAVRHEIVGRVEERFYRSSLAPLVPDRVRFVDGRRRPDRLAVEVRRLARSFRPRRDPAAVARRVLGAFDGFVRRGLLGSATVMKGAPSPRAPRP